MRVEELVGERIRSRREGLEMTQEQLGRKLGELLGHEWSRQAVSAAEKGKRGFTAAELVAIAFALETSVGNLLTPNPNMEGVELPRGAVLPRDAVIATVLPRLSAEKTLSDMLETLDRLHQDFSVILQGLDLAADEMKLLREQLIIAAQVANTRDVYYGQDQPAGATQDQPIVAAIVTSDRGVLVGRRNDGTPPWTFIAGEQDAVKDENPADTAIREVKEETGLRIVAGEVIGERDHPKTGRHMIYLAAKPTHGTEIFVNDEQELAEVRWVSLAEADELLPGMFEPVREHLERELGGTDR